MSDNTDPIADLLSVLRTDVIPTFDGLDLAQPSEATAKLAEALPLDGPVLTRVRELVDAASEAGTLCPKENMGVRFGRLAKDESGYSIDAVEMRGPGPRHAHPSGEIDLCFALEGEPRFCGNAPGWTIYGPGSVHVPTVTAGAMRILYFLPGGQIDFTAS
ncbi:MAG: DUF4863 family protein [Planctomycetes bacterium]|nr:DUF4863 family protein [Planctomycetota bacterium]